MLSQRQPANSRALELSTTNMECYSDKINKRLVYIGRRANNRFWDDHWDSENTTRKAFTQRPASFTVYHTKKFLPCGSKILEGGCGYGINLYSLHAKGYNAYGIDYACETVKKLKMNLPELNVCVGDVRALPYPDEEFDGYWSLGVLEHFYNGFENITAEAKRVLKTKGYFFVTVPYMNLLRKVKVFLNCYPFWQKDEAPENFYQFVLNKDDVISAIEKHGFKLIFSSPFDGVKGLKDEIDLFRKPLAAIYKSTNVSVRILRKSLDWSVRKISGHMILLVFQKI